MMDFLKSNKGFSLPEIMIAVAISGVVALGAAKMMSDNQKNQSYIQTMAEINNMTNVVKMAIGDKKNCNSFISGRTRAGEATLVSGVDYASIDIGDPTRKTSILNAVPATYGKFSVSGIRLVSSAENPRIKTLRLTFDYKNSPFMNDAATERKRIIKEISFLADYKMGTTGLPASTDPLECGDLVEDTLLESQEALCNSLGSDFAEWGNPVANKCNIKEFKCPPGQVPWVVTSLGKVVCKNTQDTLDPNSMIEGAPISCPATSTNIRIEFSGGRYSLVCSGGSSCTPAVPCPTVVDNTQCGQPALDSCGNSCGTGTRREWGPWTDWGACNSTLGTQPQLSACIGYSACSSGAINNCTGCTGPMCPSSNWRSIPVSCSCTPTVSCATLRSNTCSTANAGSDSCGTACGMGTNNCCNDVVCVGKTKWYSNSAGFLTTGCSQPGMNCSTPPGGSNCDAGPFNPYVMCGMFTPTGGLTCSSTYIGTYKAESAGACGYP